MHFNFNLRFLWLRFSPCLSAKISLSLPLSVQEKEICLNRPAHWKKFNPSIERSDVQNCLPLLQYQSFFMSVLATLILKVIHNNRFFAINFLLPIDYTTYSIEDNYWILFYILFSAYISIYFWVYSIREKTPIVMNIMIAIMIIPLHKVTELNHYSLVPSPFKNHSNTSFTC